MLVSEIKNEKGIVLVVSGRIDTTTSPLLHARIASIPNDIPHVAFDFKDVEYISSMGLRELLICRQRFNGDRMSITNVSPKVYHIFEITGFHHLIPIEVMEEDVATYVHLSFKDFLKKKVDTSPHSLALVGAAGSFTWEEVDIYSQIIASDLQKAGVRRGTHVAICGANSCNWVLTFYAIQKLGAMAQLLNFAMEASEIAEVATIGDITHLCYGRLSATNDAETFIADIKSTGCPMETFIPIGDDTLDVKRRFNEYDNCKHRFNVRVRGDDPCVMIFTSGSTGKPKGVLLSAYNILNASKVNYMDQTLSIQDRTCLVTPLFHIFGLVPGLFANALAGATIYIPENIRTGTIIDTIHRDKCTVFYSVPTMLIAMMNSRHFSPERLATLRCTVLAGAAATETQMQMFREKLPNDHFMVAYGLSEMAPVSITRYNDTDEHLLHTVGRPVENIQIKIVDPDTGKNRPVGVPGEILIQGYNMMLGYYGVPLFEQPIDAQGWLHTGDLGFLAEDGYLSLSGRLKDIIIRGGENIVPREIESAVTEVSIIDDVKVVGVPSDFYGEEVAACVTLRGGAEWDEDAVREALSRRLARFKMPSYFLVYDEFPKLGSGKVDVVTLKNSAYEMIKAQGRR